MFSKQILSSLIETCESDIALVKELMENCVAASVTDLMTVILTKLENIFREINQKTNYEQSQKELMELKEDIKRERIFRCFTKTKETEEIRSYLEIAIKMVLIYCNYLIETTLH